MRLGVWLAMFGLASAIGACSGGYPLPPTRCDDFCEATHGMQCENGYEPASCVSLCEQTNVDIEACDVPFQALLKCFRTTPGVLDALCVYGGPVSYAGGQPSCQPERDALGICVGAVELGGGG